MSRSYEKVSGLTIIVVLALTGCGAKYFYEPKDSKDTAHLQLSLLSKSGGTEKMPTFPYVYIATKAECKQALLLNHDFDHFFLEGNPAQFKNNNRWIDLVGYKIKANEPTVVIGSSKVETYYDGMTRSFSKCTAKLKFTPRSGKTYRFFYDGGESAGSDCYVTIKEVISNEGDESLVAVNDVTDKLFDCK